MDQDKLKKNLRDQQNDYEAGIRATYPWIDLTKDIADFNYSKLNGLNLKYRYEFDV